MPTHTYNVTTRWTGDLGAGTAGYRSYNRDLEIAAAGKSQTILGSSDPAYRGDATRFNPEDLLVGSLSACHMLWLLHLCSEAKIIVKEYTDDAVGTLNANADGSGEFTEVILRPHLVLEDPSRAPEIPALSDRAHKLCFIARSVNFTVRNEPTAS